MSIGRMLLWVTVTALSIACGDGGGPSIQTYTVGSAPTTATIHQLDGTLLTHVNLDITRHDTLISGASLKYAVSAGDLSAGGGVSEPPGVATVTWTITPAQYAGQSDLTFSACADDQAPTACTPKVILTIHP